MFLCNKLIGQCIWPHLFQFEITWSVGKQFARNKRVSLAIQHTVQVQWSILKYNWDKTKEAYWWQNILHDPRISHLLFTDKTTLTLYNEMMIMPEIMKEMVINLTLNEVRNTLRKHAYSNILKISPPKNENFQIKNSNIFSYFCSV